MNLFDSAQSPRQIPMPNADITYYPGFFDHQTADKLFDTIYKETPWQEDEIKLFGKTYKQPRLTSFYANNKNSYSYSNITMTPNSFTATLSSIKEKIEKLISTTFTSCLLNLYRNGQDSNGWHADDEKELGINPIIASISLGQERFFHLKHKDDKTLKAKLLLEHGSLLVMKGETQHHWLHQIPKSKTQNGPRINLTFRIIH